MSHASSNKEQISVHLHVVVVRLWMYACVYMCTCVCHPGDSKSLLYKRLNVGVDSQDTRLINTQSHTSALCYKRLNKTKKLQRCKKHTTLWTSHWVWICSVSLHAPAFTLLSPCLSPLSFSFYLLFSTLIHYSALFALPPSTRCLSPSLYSHDSREGAVMSCHHVLSVQLCLYDVALHVSLLCAPFVIRYKGLNAPFNNDMTI